MTCTNIQTYRDSDTDHLDASDSISSVTVGLVPSPGHCERVATDISASLPGLLAENVDNSFNWEIRLVADPLTGSDIETPRLLDEIDDWRHEHGWAYAISLTDLPVHEDDRVVVADASIGRKLAWVSLPPLGVINLRTRTRAAVIELVNEMRWGDSQSSEQRGHASRPKIGRSVAEVAPRPDDDRDIDVRYLAPRLTGHARLLAGMVYANRPWTLFPSFKTTIATAFATGGYGLIFSTLWELGNVYGLPRLVTLMIVAMSILIGWVIISHGLWQSHRGASSQYLTTLYNTATLLTITSGVVFAYALIFLLLLTASMVYIPASMLESTIQQSVTPASYVRIAWITASVATIAGAVGAGLEDTDAVRNATFGWRQLHRFEEYEKTWGSESSEKRRQRVGRR